MSQHSAAAAHTSFFSNNKKKRITKGCVSLDFLKTFAPSAWLKVGVRMDSQGVAMPSVMLMVVLLVRCQWRRCTMQRIRSEHATYNKFQTIKQHFMGH